MAPVKVTNLTLRDGQQSQYAGRFRKNIIEKLAPYINEMGYDSTEMDGGTRGQIPMRFLGENPYENLRDAKEKLPDTETQMLVRGQTLEGYKNYPDDVVKEFIRTKAKNGMNVFRVFDALNYMPNLKTCIDTVKELQAEGHNTTVEGCISYTVSDLHTTEYWVSKAQELKDMGADRLCIKDMAGLLTPETARDLIPALNKVGLPVTLHMHATMGTAEATLLTAIELDVDKIDLADHYISGGSGHVSSKRFLELAQASKNPKIRERAPQVIIQNDEFDDLLLEAGLLNADKEVPHDATVIAKLREAGIPGGMLSTFKSQIVPQLKPHGMTWEDALPDLLDEIVQVRKDFGSVPLVTPTSQIVGTQAALNYIDKLHTKKIMSSLRQDKNSEKLSSEEEEKLLAQIKEPYDKLTIDSQEFLMGYLGENIAPPKEELIALAEKKSGKTRITCRPADLLEGNIENAKTALQKAAKTALEKATHKESWLSAQEPAGLPSSTKAKHIQNLKNIIENPSMEDALLVAMFDAENEGINSVLNTAAGTPENMPKYEQAPTLPAYLTASPSARPGIIGDHEITSSIGRMALEKLSKTALELTRLDDGTITGLDKDLHNSWATKVNAEIVEIADNIAQNLTHDSFTGMQRVATYNRIETILTDRFKQLGASNAVLTETFNVLKNADNSIQQEIKNKNDIAHIKYMQDMQNRMLK